ncbi:hypothetical protein Tco_1328256 [Tanacetum coccineum]
MTRSSTNELFTPYKEPERESRSSRRHFKTLSLDKLRSPDFNLLSDQEYSEEEEAKAMAETMEQYMSKTQMDCGSGVVRPKIDNKDQFELKGQFLKELRENTFSGSDNKDAKEHIEKVLKIVDLFHVPNITEDQLMLRVFLYLNRSASHWLRNGTVEVILFNGLDVPTRQILDSKGEEHEENSNLIKEIRATTDAAIRNQGASIKTLEIQIGQMNKVLQERGFRSLTSSTGMNPRDQVKLISTIIEADSYLIRRIGSSQYIVSTGQNNMLEDIKVPLILGRPFLSTARAKIDVYKRKITLRVGEERIVFTSVKPASSLIKRVYMLSLRERMELDLEARLMGETLVLNRSLDPFLEDYIELNDLNEPFELRRNQGDDLMPTIEEGEVIEEFRTRDDELDAGIDDYPSYCDYDKKIHIDCAHNLKFSCMIGFEFTHANFFPLLYVNVMSKKFHNSIMKDKMVYKGNNVIGALMNVPIFVGNFSVVTDFAVLENMDDYRDEGMGDVIFGEPFLREVGINAKRFEGMITIYNGNDEVTYQMVRSHPRFKHHTNEQCNKIPPLLKVSEEDKMNGISHAYQKLLKGSSKGVFEFRTRLIRDAKMEECHRWHISVHEMEW